MERIDVLNSNFSRSQIEMFEESMVNKNLEVKLKRHLAIKNQIR